MAQKIDTISTFSITGYVDAYYACYSDSAGPGNFQKFVSICPRNNSPSLNLAQLSFRYAGEKIRGAAVFHFGDIAAATWAPAPYNQVQEANVGVKLFSKLWIDAGFFRSHFGTEFLFPAENMTSSVSVGSFYEPFYESGVRLNFDPTPKLEINLFLLNGYGVFVDNNKKKSMGMGVTYTLNDNVGIGYTNYIGDDSPEGTAVSHLRIGQNVFFNYQRKKIKVQIGGDYCLQKNADLALGANTASMYSVLATVRYQLLKKFGIYGRGEIFQDPDGFMSTIITDYFGKKTGYKLWGLTLGAEYKPTTGSYVRLEARMIKMDEDQYIFNANSTLLNGRYEVMLNAGVTFDLLKNFGTK